MISILSEYLQLTDDSSSTSIKWSQTEITPPLSLVASSIRTSSIRSNFKECIQSGTSPKAYNRVVTNCPSCQTAGKSPDRKPMIPRVTNTSV